MSTKTTFGLSVMTALAALGGLAVPALAANNINYSDDDVVLQGNNLSSEQKAKLKSDNHSDQRATQTQGTSVALVPVQNSGQSSSNTNAQISNSEQAAANINIDSDLTGFTQTNVCLLLC